MTESNEGPAEKLVAVAGPIVITAGILAGIATLGYQLYVWLRVSVWVPISMNSALRWLEVRWAHAPTDWFGLHSVLEFLPLSLALPIVGVVIAGILAASVAR